MADSQPEAWLDHDFRLYAWTRRGDLGWPCFSSPGPTYEDTIGVMPWDDISSATDRIASENIGLDRLVVHIFNQGNEGSCVANAFCQGHQIIQAMQKGTENVIILSPISLYKRIGRSPNSGATLQDGLMAVQEEGILPLDSPANSSFDHTMPPTGFYVPLPSGWQRTAKMFKGHEFFVIKSAQGMFSALCNMTPVIYGRDGHAICATTPVRVNGQLAVKYANSWGDWGDRGFGYDSLTKLQRSVSWAVALRSVVIPSAEQYDLETESMLQSIGGLGLHPTPTEPTGPPVPEPEPKEPEPQQADATHAELDQHFESKND